MFDKCLVKIWCENQLETSGKFWKLSRSTDVDLVNMLKGLSEASCQRMSKRMVNIAVLSCRILQL